MSRDRSIAIVALVCAGLGGCLEAREGAETRHQDNCTTCHGSPSREGTPLQRSAPPVSLDGRTTARRGVGAHLQHVMANEVHGGVPCETCHEVPDETISPGHADTALPAEVVFTGVALAQTAAPSYGGGTCSDVYCHGSSRSLDWVPLSEPQPRCERCHSMPPSAPHPAVDDCSICHGEVVDAGGRVIAPERHVDGVVDVDERCDGCHGTGPLGAPPPSLTGDTARTTADVGAHRIHLEGSGRARRVACNACHSVPAATADEGHLDPPPAEVELTGIANAGGRVAVWNRDAQSCAQTWCHGPSAGEPSPTWTTQTSNDCTACHGMPPPAPHPQMDACELCHGTVVDGDDVVLAPSAHVDGVVDVNAPLTCNACHGDATSAAPPRDLMGNAAPSSPGVGAHRSHVEGGPNARPVPCEECHRVPATLLEPGHLDTEGPAELDFNGVARSFASSPTYDGVTCSNTYCHGAVFPFGHPSGAAVPAPSWTAVTPGPSACDACHGLPPPPPHPPGPSFCSDCHPTVGPLLDILDPLRHVDGQIDLSL